MTNLQQAVATLAMAAYTGGVLVAQQPVRTTPAQPRQQQAAPQATQAGQRTQWQNADHTLATCLAIDNQEEIAIAEFAKSKAESSEVQEFAQMMIEEHQAFLQKLQRFAPEATAKGYLDQRQAAGATSTQPQGVQPAGGVVRNAQGVIQQTAGTTTAQPGIDFIQLHRELAQECLAKSKEELTKKDSDDFDHCFLGHQLAKHAAMKVKLEVFQRHTSGELKQVLADGSKTTQKHLDHAEKLMKSLTESSEKTTAEKRKEDRKSDKQDKADKKNDQKE